MNQFPEIDRDLYRVWLIGLATQHQDVVYDDALLRQVNIDNLYEAIDRNRGDRRITLQHWGTIILGLSRVMLYQTQSFQHSCNSSKDEDCAFDVSSAELTRQDAKEMSSLLTFFQMNDATSDVIDITIDKDEKRNGQDVNKRTLNKLKQRKNNKRLKIDYPTQTLPMLRAIDMSKMILDLGLNKSTQKNYAQDKLAMIMKTPTRKLPIKLNYLYERELLGDKKSVTFDDSIEEIVLEDMKLWLVEQQQQEVMDADNNCDKIESLTTNFNSSVADIENSDDQQQQQPVLFLPENDNTKSRDLTVSLTPYVCSFDVEHTQPIWCRYQPAPSGNTSFSSFDKVTSLLDTSLTSIKSVKSTISFPSNVSLPKLAIEPDYVNSANVVGNIQDDDDDNDSSSSDVALRKRVARVCTRWPYKGDNVPLEQLVTRTLPQGEPLSKINLSICFAVLLELASDNLVRLDQRQQQLHLSTVLVHQISMTNDQPDDILD